MGWGIRQDGKGIYPSPYRQFLVFTVPLIDKYKHMVGRDLYIPISRTYGCIFAVYWFGAYFHVLLYRHEYVKLIQSIQEFKTDFFTLPFQPLFKKSIYS